MTGFNVAYYNYVTNVAYYNYKLCIMFEKK